MSAITKRAVLAQWLRDTAGAVESGITVVERFRENTLSGDLRSLRTVMGDPVYYADVLLRGRSQDGPAALERGSSPNDQHTYDVRLWYEYTDASTYANSTQKAFDALTYEAGGLAYELRNSQYITADNTTVEVAALESDEVQIDLLHQSNSQRLIAHLFTATLQLQ